MNAHHAWPVWMPARWRIRWKFESLVARRRVSKRLVAIVTVGIFVVITGAAMLTGHWQNNITTQQYLEQQPYVKGYGHPISGS